MNIMQMSFFKNSSHHILLLIVLVSTCSVSCTEKSFVCWNKQRTEATAFAFDDSLNTVTVDDRLTYSTFTSSKESLNSSMPGGTHILQMNPNSIILQVIQDTVFTKTRLSSGKFIKDYNEIKTEHDYLNQRRYHAVYPVVWKYVFDKNSATLSFYANPLPIPRSSIEQKFIYDKSTNDLAPQKVRDLTEKESSAVFPPKEKAYTRLYPNCEEESPNSIKRFFRSIFRLFQFV